MTIKRFFLFLLTLNLFFPISSCVSSKAFKQIQSDYNDKEKSLLLLQNKNERLSGEITLLRRALKNERKFRTELENMIDSRNKEIEQKTKYLLECANKLDRAETTSILECLANFDNCLLSKKELNKSKDVLVNEHKEQIQRIEDRYSRLIQEANENKNALIDEQQGHLQRMESKNMRLLSETEKKAEYKGMLAVWQSLSIEAKPRVDSGILFDDYYYDIIIKINGNDFFKHVVQTKSQESAFTRTFNTIKPFANIVAFLK